MPAAPAAPPPAAPAAAPKPASSAPPPAAPKAPPAAPSREDNEPSFMGEYAAEIDKMSGEDIQPMQARKPKAKTPEKPPVKPPETAAAEPKEGDQIGGADSPATHAADPPPEPSTIPEIRKAYTALKKKAQEEYEPTIQKLQSRVKELETSNPADVQTLTAKLEAAEKRRDELENEIHFVDYSKSNEFQEKFAQPYNQAWRKAAAEITQLSRMMEDGTTRKATQDDILALANAPLDQLDSLAQEWFPNSSARVIRHVEKIKDLAEAQSEALEKARSAGAERSKRAEIERKASTEKTVKMLEEAHKAVTQKWPKMFGPVQDDPDGNALLERGDAMWQKAFRPTPDNAPKTPEEAIQIHALMRNKIRNHDRLALWLKKANAQIKELETALSQYENSNPNGGLDRGRPSSGGLKAELSDAMDELDALAKKS